MYNDPIDCYKRNEIISFANYFIQPDTDPPQRVGKEKEKVLQQL